MRREGVARSRELGRILYADRWGFLVRNVAHHQYQLLYPHPGPIVATAKNGISRIFEVFTWKLMKLDETGG